MSECGPNRTQPIYNATSCAAGVVAFPCTCEATVLCCGTGDCERCYESEQKDALFSFSWPLVAGWYAMLVVLFCFGRRGRFVNRHCFFFPMGRRRDDARPEAGSDASRTEVEITPVVKTRLITEADLGDEPPVCTICLNPLALDDVVAALDCPHLYHGDCIVEWLRRKSSCPLCAQRIDVEDGSASPPTSATPSAPETAANVPPRGSSARRVRLPRLLSLRSSGPTISIDDIPPPNPDDDDEDSRREPSGD
ncbi:hypothetical protein CTAYLR_003641 [Chrysophaeum taylorii]|uniref:RING-type domain-containing protein n=1 Tax=Chrysophaeum taylorii TaxID=2483200 RepID=A0AAD7UC41_9STRA|nr:hypothetical protein CTAYLR_003641 [Chrysophaeum taylorii]